MALCALQARGLSTSQPQPKVVSSTEAKSRGLFGSGPASAPSGSTPSGSKAASMSAANAKPKGGTAKAPATTKAASAGRRVHLGEAVVDDSTFAVGDTVYVVLDTNALEGLRWGGRTRAGGTQVAMQGSRGSPRRRDAPAVTLPCSLACRLPGALPLSALANRVAGCSLGLCWLAHCNS